MKKIIAISFLFIFLCANTEIGQLFKLPNLVEHFFEHHEHQDENNVSFINFVKSHYHDIEKHTDTDEHDEHQNLPFKTIDTNINTVIAFENQTVFYFKKPISITSNNTISYNKEFYISKVFACIWLPPKLS